MKVITRRWIALGAIAVLACILAGGVIAAEFGGIGDPERLDAAVSSEPMVRVAEIAAIGDAPSRGVFAQLTSTGHFCLWDAPSAASPQRQGGCNSADDPLGGRELSVSFAYDGGPAVTKVRDARLIGIVAAEVADVQLLMNDGTTRKISLRNASIAAERYRAFGYRLKKVDLRSGVAPVAVLALDSGGREVDRQATGFAG
jgi:hypothetical protein